MRFRSRTLLAALVLLSCAWRQSPAQAGPSSVLANADAPAAPITAEQLAERLEEKNRERAQALCAFAGSRLYHLEYHGLGGNKEASMTVRMDYRAPASKTFTVITQQGPRIIIEHVFKKLLAGEQEAMDEKNLRAAALSLENYEFTLEKFEKASDGGAYVLSVKPRSRNKFLYQGRIWVNAADFAVTRIDAAPAKNPSFWIKRTRIEHSYVKVGDFWLPARNRTESEIRLGGRAVLAIEYTDYRILSAAPLGSAQRAGGSEPACHMPPKATTMAAPVPANSDAARVAADD